MLNTLVSENHTLMRYKSEYPTLTILAVSKIADGSPQLTEDQIRALPDSPVPLTDD